MTIETQPYDTADYLEGYEDILAYLNAYLEDGTPSELRTALETVARSNGVSELARRTGMTRAGIYKALGKDGNPSFETIRAILAAMELQFAIVPREAA